MLLTQEERYRFIEYCKQEAKSYQDLITQIANLPNMGNLESIRHRYGILVIAYNTIIEHLESVEDYSVLDQTHSE
jgi:hypothetical protein